jgi:Uma2 family endonuclease
MVTTRLYAIEDLWELSSGDTNYELIEGELFEVSPVKRGHGIAQLTIGSRILSFVKVHKLGIVGTEVGFIFQRKPDTVLAPDVAFVSAERLGPEGKYWSDVPPDLAVEIVSRSNTRAEIDRKVRIYLASGVRAVWVVRPAARAITIHRPGTPAQTLTENDTLDGGEILPGFALPLSDLFGQ